MCEKIGGVARDGKSTCSKCGGIDAYGSEGRRKMEEKKPTKIIMVDYPEDKIGIHNEFICTKVEETRFEKKVFTPRDSQTMTG